MLALVGAFSNCRVESFGYLRSWLVTSVPDVRGDVPNELKTVQQVSWGFREGRAWHAPSMVERAVGSRRKSTKLYKINGGLRLRWTKVFVDPFM